MTNQRLTLTSRDVLTQAFEAKARKGYEPHEVDAYLRLVADSLDILHDEIETLKLQVATAIPTAAPAAYAAPLTAQVAPSRAENESLEMILRLAQKTAEETLGEAHRRADELLAEANFRAAQVAREADRKAFEAASRTQSELRTVETDIETRRDELTAVHSALQAEQSRIRDVAAQLLSLSAELTWDEDLVDLTDDSAVNVAYDPAPIAAPAPIATPAPASTMPAPTYETAEAYHPTPTFQPPQTYDIPDTSQYRAE